MIKRKGNFKHKKLVIILSLVVVIIISVLATCFGLGVFSDPLKKLATRESYTKHLEVSVSYFFLHDCFDIVIPFSIAKTIIPS